MDDQHSLCEIAQRVQTMSSWPAAFGPNGRAPGAQLDPGMSERQVLKSRAIPRGPPCSR
jgi:hypothetical protein